MTDIPNRGGKHTCASCATRFFDMNKTPAACPKCGQKVAIVVRTAARRARRTMADEKAGQDKNPLGAHLVVVTDDKAKPKPKTVKWK